MIDEQPDACASTQKVSMALPSHGVVSIFVAAMTVRPVTSTEPSATEVVPALTVDPLMSKVTATSATVHVTPTHNCIDSSKNADVDFSTKKYQNSNRWHHYAGELSATPISKNNARHRSSTSTKKQIRIPTEC